MAKVMCIVGMLFGILMLFLFAFDMALGFPFARASVTMDVAFILGGLLLVYLGWSAKRSLD